MAPRPATLDQVASYLTSGYHRWDGRPALHWELGSSRVLTVNLTGLTPQGQAAARAALDAWEMVANIQFQEVRGGAKITFADEGDRSNNSVSYYPDGSLLSATVKIGQGWLDKYGSAVGTYGFQTYIHEIGHALGLGHSGPYDGGATYANAAFQNDSWQATVMSYLDQDENPTIRAAKAYVLTPMMADVIAIQALYGAPKAGATAGNTTYGVGSAIPNYLAGVFGPGAGDLARHAMTVHDVSGIDTYDFSGTALAQVIDLTPGTLSSVYGLIDNLWTSRGSVIENATGGGGADRITGNQAANVLRGMGGADSLLGGLGADRLEGGDGNDVLYGGAGVDRAFGEAGNDVLYGGADSDSLYGGTGDDALWGEAGNDRLWGEAGNDRLEGGDGADLLYGGAGLDRLEGSGGADSLYGDDGDDTLIGGLDADAVYGGAGNDGLFGGDGNDRLLGGDGADRLDGGTGNDALYGGVDADVFVFTGGRDVLWYFQDNVDTILFDDALWGGGARTAEAIMRSASVVDGDVVFTFGANTLRLEGRADLGALVDDLGWV